MIPLRLSLDSGTADHQHVWISVCRGARGQQLVAIMDANLRRAGIKRIKHPHCVSLQYVVRDLFAGEPAHVDRLV